MMSISLRAFVRPAMQESEFDLLAGGCSTVDGWTTGRRGSVSLMTTEYGRKEEECL